MIPPLPYAVVSTVPLPEPHRARLASAFRRVQTGRDLRGADAVFCVLTDRMDASRLRGARRLKVVSLMAVGTDSVDVAEATRLGILVTNTPGVLTETTADFAWALLLAAARRVVEGDRAVRAGRFRGWEPFGHLGADVHGTTLGIVGPGRIGRAVARRARGFGMRVLFAGRSRAELLRVLRESDFVSLHCPLSRETRHRIGARELSRMKPTAVLVNTARGPVVDERALVRALRRGTIAAAGLDVYEREPGVEAGLLRLKNIVLAPHIASASHATRNRMAAAAVENLIVACSGRRPPHPVNPEVLPTLRLRLRR